MKIISRSLEDVEVLVAEERAGLKRDFDVWRATTKQRAKAQLSSARGIATIAGGAGLLLTTLLFARRSHRHRDHPRRGRSDEAQPMIAPDTKRKGLAAIVGGLIVSGLRLRYGNPWNAVPVFLRWGREQYARRYASRPIRSAHPAHPPATPPPRPGTVSTGSVNSPHAR